MSTMFFLLLLLLLQIFLIDRTVKDGGRTTSPRTKDRSGKTLFTEPSGLYLLLRLRCLGEKQNAGTVSDSLCERSFHFSLVE